MRLIVVITLLLNSLTSFATSKYPEILTSIRPLQSIVANITNGVDSVGLIVEEGTSIHYYAMKPIDAKKINNSKLVILIDRNFESFLENSVINNKNVKYLEVAKLPGVKLIDAQHDCNHHEHDEDEEEDEERDHEEHALYDYHIWFDLENVKHIATGVAEYFAKENPKDAKIYQANLAKFLSRLEDLDNETKENFKNITKTDYNYIVTHNAYQYFINRYSLKEPTSITFDHGNNIGAKEFYEIKKMINSNKVNCIIEEPSFSSNIIDKLKQDSKIRTYYFDPEIGIKSDSASASDDTLNLYFKMMHELGNIFKSCLVDNLS